MAFVGPREKCIGEIKFGPARDFPEIDQRVCPTFQVWEHAPIDMKKARHGEHKERSAERCDVDTVQVFAAQVYGAVSQQTDVEREQEGGLRFNPGEEAENPIQLFLGAGSGLACAAHFRLPRSSCSAPGTRARLFDKALWAFVIRSRLDFTPKAAKIQYVVGIC